VWPAETGALRRTQAAQIDGENLMRLSLCFPPANVKRVNFRVRVWGRVRRLLSGEFAFAILHASSTNKQ
jgi:hypothetical protein